MTMNPILDIGSVSGPTEIDMTKGYGQINLRGSNASFYVILANVDFAGCN